MSASAKEIADRYILANTNLRQGFRDLLIADGRDVERDEKLGKSFLIQFEFDDDSRRGIPRAINRLVQSVYTQRLPVWALRIALACDPEALLPEGQTHAITVDLVIHGHKQPSPKEQVLRRIAIEKLECFLDPVVMISPDVHPHNYVVERTPMLDSKNGSDREGGYRIGYVGPAVIEAATEVMLNYQRYLAQQTANSLNPDPGRAQRAVGALKRAVYPRIGRPTATPAVRIEVFSPPFRLFP